MDKRFLYFETPIGTVEISGIPGGVTGVAFIEQSAAAVGEPYPCMVKAKEQLLEYFEGRRKEFDFPLVLDCTDFQRRVYRELAKIPYGSASTYGEVAARIGKPAACRAVGQANNKNKHVIVIPCHRVVHKDSGMAGYGGGVWRKEFLLGLEKRASEITQNAHSVC